MVVQIDQQDYLTAVGFWTHDGFLFFIRGSRVSHVLAARGRVWWEHRWQWLWVIVNYEGTIGGVHLLKMQLEDIVIGGQDSKVAHGTFQESHVCKSSS